MEMVLINYVLLSIKKSGDQSQSNLLTQIVHPKEPKRQRHRAQRAAITEE